MSIDSPKPNRCDAQFADQTYCGKFLLPGTTRCEAHGAAAQLFGRPKESLYTARLRAAFPRQEDQLLFDEIPKATNLEEEIRVCRMQIVKLTTRLELGEEFIYTDKANHKPLANQIAEDSQANVQPRVTEGAKSIRDLLDSQLDLLRRLVATQADLRPGSEIGGNLRVSIRVIGGSQPSKSLPDLTSDSETPLLHPPASDTTLDVEPVQRSGSGYDDE